MPIQSLRKDKTVAAVDLIQTSAVNWQELQSSFSKNAPEQTEKPLVVYQHVTLQPASSVVVKLAPFFTHVQNKMCGT